MNNLSFFNDFLNFEGSQRIKKYLDVLQRKQKIIKVFFITTVAAVTLGSFLIKPVYRAKVTLLIDVESPNILTTSGAVAMDSQNYYAYKDYLQTQIEIITSRPIARQVINDLKLLDLREYSKSKDPILKIIKSLKVEPVRDTRLVRVFVDNKDRELVTKIANTLAEAYVKRNLVYTSKSEFLNLMKNEYLKLQSKLSEYEKIYKDDHPEMIKLKKEIADLINKLEQEKKNISNYGTEENNTQTAYQGTLEGLKANNVSIVEPAEVPVAPIYPKKLLNILLAIIFGAAGGICLAFLTEYLEDAIRSPEELEILTNWPILGSIPVVDAEKKLPEFEKDIFVHNNPKGHVSEAYRSFRTNILFNSTEEHPFKSMLITSPGPGEGKTMTLCNLAIAIAQNKKKVLIVDGDMRIPRLHDVFNKENKLGLSNFLCGQAKFDALAQNTNIENLSLTSSGIIPPNPSELLASNKLKEFISLASDKFDYVIFDTPPIGMLTDASLIARVVNGTIVVIENGKTSKRALTRIVKELSGYKIRVLGAFLNKASLTSKNYYNYSYYQRLEK